jgi:hypothetical protein
MTPTTRLAWVAIAYALLSIGGCASFHKSTAADVCIDVDSASLPAGIYIGQDFAEAERILGKPLNDIISDEIGTGTGYRILIYGSLRIVKVNDNTKTVGQIEWTKSGDGPNPDLLLGNSPHTSSGHLAKNYADDTEEFTLLTVCHRPHTPKLRITYRLKDGKINTISLETRRFPW